MNDDKTQIKEGKIIVAEDDSINQRLIYYHLREISNNLLFAKDGFEAIRLFEENRDVCLVLMDLRMPGLNGLEATKKILEIDPTAKVFALSAFAEEENGFEFKELGFTGYLTKPIKKDVLIETVTKYLP